MDINLLPARIDDLKSLCEKTNSPKYIGFLSAEETAAALRRFSLSDRYSLFGGYDGADRVIIGVMPQWCEELVFPIKAITFTYRECDLLSHRDFLGALMSLGITRESIGDILVEKGRAVVFVLDNISKFVLSQIEKVGNVGVKLSEGYTAPFPQLGKKESFSITVASMRIDCIVSSLCGISRKDATQKITDGMVQINSIGVYKTTTIAKAGDKIAIRKSGKYEVVSCDEFSKKGRIILKYNKYV